VYTQTLLTCGARASTAAAAAAATATTAAAVTAHVLTLHYCCNCCYFCCCCYRHRCFADSSDALTETQQHPEYHWQWQQRTRYSDAEAKVFSFHFPSGQPTAETVNLLAELDVAKQCQLLITDDPAGNFADNVYWSMCQRTSRPEDWNCPARVKGARSSREEENFGQRACGALWANYSQCMQ
jgi:hypothetical protein